MEWGPPRIRLSVPPQYNAHLLAWRADPTGEWRALVTWERYGPWVRVPDTGLVLGLDKPCTRLPGRERGLQPVPRVRLDDDRRWWPTTPGPRAGHYGILDADTTLQPVSAGAIRDLASVDESRRPWQNIASRAAAARPADTPAPPQRAGRTKHPV